MMMMNHRTAWSKGGIKEQQLILYLVYVVDVHISGVEAVVPDAVP